MTLTQLKYIVETAETGTISKAAEKLYISQPSLTAAIRELEHEFGITIFQHKASSGQLFSRCTAAIAACCILFTLLPLCRTFSSPLPPCCARASSVQLLLSHTPSQ